MTTTTTFNLLDEPWIVVLDSDGSNRSVGLLDLIRQAGAIRRLAGELPTQDAAILRLVLAILYRALPVEGDEEQRALVWARWWRDGLPVEQITEYLEDYRHRFDLLDADNPFFQVADLHTASGNNSGIDRLIADLPPSGLFTNRAGSGAASLSLAEATRWVVHCQAFDVSGIKSGAVGDDQVKGGRGYPIGIGWAGNLGIIVLEGHSLVETLLLNLVLSMDSDDDRDLPPWEVDVWSAAATGAEAPAGPVQALTWQIRRLRLFVVGGEVRDALISNGDPIRLRNQHRVETMTAWRQSPTQAKKHGEDLAYMPRAHLPGRLMWRGLGSLIAADPVAAGVEKRADALAPGNVGWIDSLRAFGALPSDQVVSLHVVGCIYGSNNSVVETVVSDRMLVQVQVLHHEALQRAAVRAATLAEQVVARLRWLASDLAIAAGREGEGDAARVNDLAYQRVDHEFRPWLRDLSADHARTHEKAWRTTVQRIGNSIADDLYAEAGTAAVIGRVLVDGNGRGRRHDSAGAHRLFRKRLRELIAAEPDLDHDDPAQEED